MRAGSYAQVNHVQNFKKNINTYMQLGIEGATLVVKDLFLLRLTVQKSLQFGPLLAGGAHLVNQRLDVLLRLQINDTTSVGLKKRETNIYKKKGLQFKRESWPRTI